jgi:endogenous inhibitor of DNA gyrase (YacG/DUF329 family)
MNLKITLIKENDQKKTMSARELRLSLFDIEDQDNPLAIEDISSIIEKHNSVDCARCGYPVLPECSYFMIEDKDKERDYSGPYCCKQCAREDLTELHLADESLSDEEQERLIEGLNND